ncbi:MAG: hypothetical protein QM813_23740 [Verrucomicrobiota bacterium]
MSEFKFACPVCGQHITCDSESAGTQMGCPTCFRKLVVPQAPSPGAKSFVLTAALVQERPATSLENGKSGTPVAPAPAKRFPVAAIAVGVLLCGAAAGATVFFLVKQGKSSSPKPDEPDSAKIVATNAPPKLVLLPPPATATNWTLNLAEARIPDAPAQGVVRGFGFKLERAVIQGGKLDLRQGPKWPPDVGVSIHLFADRAEDLAGKVVVLESARTNSPRVFLRWKNDQDQAQTKEYRKGYAARVEFGSVTNNHLAGKIYLATPDDTKSYAAGTFSAEIRKPAKK